MSVKINLSITKEETLLQITENATELDIVLAIGSLFDRLAPETKQLIIPKLKNISSCKVDYINSQDNRLS